MAVYSITFDTVTKQATFLKDGVEVPNVTNVSLYKYGEEFSINLEQASKDEANKSYERITTYASANATELMQQVFKEYLSGE